MRAEVLEIAHGKSLDAKEVEVARARMAESEAKRLGDRAHDDAKHVEWVR